MSEKYFAVVIGGGPGGTPAAMALASAGKKVLLVEASGKLGGACLFVGCIPSKIIKFSADEIVSFGKTAGKFGINHSIDPEKSWDYIQKKMDKILQARSGNAMKKAEQIPGLTVMNGKAKFTSQNTVEILTPEGKMIEAAFEKAIIATGAKSWIPPISGNGAGEVLVTENFFRIDKLPRSLAIVGGGPIGVEIAQMMTNLGVQVTIIEVMDSLLKGIVEKDFAGILAENIRKSGITVHLSSQVANIDKSDSVFTLEIKGGFGSPQKLFVEKVLVSAGKVPNIDGLGLDALKMEYSNKGIRINEFLETSVSGIYAAGDVTTGPKFAHLATHETQIAVKNILMGNQIKVDFSKNTWVLFSEPEIVVAGLTEEQANQAGLTTVTGIYNYQIDATAQIQEISSAFLRLIADSKNGRIVGVHILGKAASELSGEAAEIVANNLTLDNVVNAVHPHPTLTEAFGFLAGEMIGRQKMQKVN